MFVSSPSRRVLISASTAASTELAVSLSTRVLLLSVVVEVVSKLELFEVSPEEFAEELLPSAVVEDEFVPSDVVELDELVVDVVELSPEVVEVVSVVPDEVVGLVY